MTMTMTITVKTIIVIACITTSQTTSSAYLYVFPAGGALKLTPEHIQGLSTGDPGRSLESLIAGGVIEYVDVNEENNCLVALDEGDITTGGACLASHQE